MVNTTKPSVCGGNTALCQITLTTCFFLEIRRTSQDSATYSYEIRQSLKDVALRLFRGCALNQSCYGLSAGWLIPTHPKGKKGKVNRRNFTKFGE